MELLPVLLDELVSFFYLCSYLYSDSSLFILSDSQEIYF